MLNHEGEYLAFGGNPSMVGVKLRDIKGIDGDGMLEAIKRQASVEPGWVEYDIINPVSKQVQRKMSFVLDLDKMYVGCGVYKNFVNNLEAR